MLTAAAELFRTKGYEATSVDDIALAANVAKGTFYYHFKAKEDLVMALQEVELNAATVKIKKRLEEGESPLTVLLDLMKDSAHWAEANPELERVMFRKKFEMIAQHGHECHPDDKAAPPIKKHFFDLIAELLAAAQKQGEIRQDQEPADLARVLIPVVMSTRMHGLMDPGGESLSARIERSMKLVIEGFKGKG